MKKNVKVELGSGNPPSSSTRVSAKGLLKWKTVFPLRFLYFNITTIPRSLELVSASDEETLDKARSHLMEESIRQLKEIGKIHERTEQEVQELRERVKGLSERNFFLVNELSESIRCQNELKNLNEYLQIKEDDAIGHRSVLASELEEKNQKIESLKLQFTQKLSELEISCSDKDVHIKMLEEELVVREGHLADRDAEIRASKLWWLVQEGIPSFVRALLNSTNFRDLNVGVKTTAIQLGLHQACMEMKEKYVDALEGKMFFSRTPMCNIR
ncbi:unnamed protein product [Lactuca virosa]|uniref:Uncharacterized protein n=1 Tax=Lactuca virosa TaxID=75947 RepID=A0AAU9LZQ1_9ASTR|nr:unnamed protein product [Lactuca virosa]